MDESEKRHSIVPKGKREFKSNDLILAIFQQLRPKEGQGKLRQLSKRGLELQQRLAVPSSQLKRVILSKPKLEAMKLNLEPFYGVAIVRQNYNIEINSQFLGLLEQEKVSLPCFNSVLQLSIPFRTNLGDYLSKIPNLRKLCLSFEEPNIQQVWKLNHQDKNFQESLQTLKSLKSIRVTNSHVKKEVQKELRESLFLAPSLESLSFENIFFQNKDEIELFISILLEYAQKIKVLSFGIVRQTPGGYYGWSPQVCIPFEESRALISLPSLEQFTLSSSLLSQEQLSSVLSALENHPYPEKLRVFNLNKKQEFNLKNFIQLRQILNQFTSLISLDLRFDRSEKLNEVEVSRELEQLIAQNTTLKHLCVNARDLPITFTSFSSFASNQKLETFKLTTPCLAFLQVPGKEVNTSVRTLRLSGIKIRYDSGLPRALQNFTGVQDLCFLHSEIGDPSFFSHLSQGMRKLKYILLSNVRAQNFSLKEQLLNFEKLENVHVGKNCNLGGFENQVRNLNKEVRQKIRAKLIDQ